MPYFWARMRAEIREAIQKQEFAAIITDAHNLPEEWRPFYTFRGPVFQDREDFYPVTGYQTRPKAIFVPVNKAKPAQNP